MGTAATIVTTTRGIAATEIETQRLAWRLRDRIGRAHFDARAALYRAFVGSEAQHAAMAIGQRRRGAARVIHGFAAAIETMSEGVEGEHGFG